LSTKARQLGIEHLIGLQLRVTNRDWQTMWVLFSMVTKCKLSNTVKLSVYQSLFRSSPVFMNLGWF